MIQATVVEHLFFNYVSSLKIRALQARLMSQSEGGISTLSSQSKKKRSRKSRDIKHGKTSRHQRVHFQRKKRDDSQNVPEDIAPEEGKL